MAEPSDSIIDTSAEEDECVYLVENLRAAGVNHKTAPVELREKLAVCEDHAPGLLSRLREELQLEEVVVVSTCNRTELYWNSEAQVEPISVFRSVLEIDSKRDAEDLAPSIYSYSGREVAKHLFEVTSGLDSMVMGETQIASQVKRAYEQARERGFTAHSLNILFQRAFETTKKVYNQTGLNVQRTSVPSVALELSEAIFEDLPGMFVVVIGTGEVAKLTIDILKSRGVHDVAFVSRSEERAREWMARYEGADAAALQNLSQVLWKADLIVACTSTDKPVLIAEDVRKALAERDKPNLPLLILDLGIPRNVDPEVGKLGQVYLHNIDDLEEVIQRNMAKLKGEADKARRVIDESLENYIKDCMAASAASTIRDIRSFAEGVAEIELDRAMRKIIGMSAKDREEVEIAVHRILGKILHPPSENLKMATRNGRGDEAIGWARRLFSLKPLFSPSEDSEKPEKGRGGLFKRRKKD